ncbi:MAG: histidine kinase [Rhizobacter sp.]|nr:histidine kinase [Rhizobacter sp.]
MSTDAPSPLSRPGFFAQVRTALTPGRVLLTIGFSTVVALALNPIFITSFASVWARTVFVGLMLLLAFTVAGLWPLRWVPRWVVQLVATGLTAPVATLVAYVWMTQGNLGHLLQNEGLWSGFVWITVCSLVLGLLLALGALYRERDGQARAQELAFALERSTLERQALDARLRLLHAQIEPHFLFNTLANVQQLVESGSPRAAPVLQSLIAYLRAAVPALGDGQATLGHEMDLVRAYLDLMRMRMPDRLAFTVSLPHALAGLRFPPMALLTLVENAVRHGIDPSEAGGHIRVEAREQDGAIVVSVSDTGVGMAETAAPGTGLTNLRERLQAFFGDAAQLQMQDEPPHGLRAVIMFPKP